MRTSDRARWAAPAVLAAVAGTASVGMAALAHEGVCLHHLGLAEAWPPMPAAEASGAPLAMPGMAMPALAAHTTMSAPCPILVGAAIGAAVLYVAALAMVVVLRPRPGEVAVAAARLVAGVRFAPLAGVLAAIAAVPLGGELLMDGTAGAAPYVAAVFLGASALAGAWALTAAARCILFFARRLVVALLAAPRQLVPGSDAPWLGARPVASVPAGVRLARRRPSRAPPLR